MNYRKEALKTLNPELKGEKRLVNAVLGLVGETGEVADVIKKHLHQGHTLDKEKIIDELGDVRWYYENLLDYFGITMQEVEEKNIQKLKDRYGDKFEASKSINRKKII